MAVLGVIPTHSLPDGTIEAVRIPKSDLRPGTQAHGSGSRFRERAEPRWTRREPQARLLRGRSRPISLGTVTTPLQKVLDFV